MKFKTYAELPIKVHYDIELPDPDVGIFNTTLTINEVTLMGHDITPMFSKAEMIEFERDALDEYFDNLRAAEEDAADRQYQERREA